jgi:hypothetical protein
LPDRKDNNNVDIVAMKIYRNAIPPSIIYSLGPEDDEFNFGGTKLPPIYRLKREKHDEN